MEVLFHSLLLQTILHVFGIETVIIGDNDDDFDKLLHIFTSLIIFFIASPSKYQWCMLCIIHLIPTMFLSYYTSQPFTGPNGAFPVFG